MGFKDDFKNLSKVQKELIESISKDFWAYNSEHHEAGFPPVDIFETDNTIEVIIGLPGLKSNADVNLNVSNNTLIINGEIKKHHDQDQMVQVEIVSGKFNRKILLPSVVETMQAKAVYKNGLLTILFSKDKGINEQKIDVDFLD